MGLRVEGEMKGKQRGVGLGVSKLRNEGPLMLVLLIFLFSFILQLS